MTDAEIANTVLRHLLENGRCLTVSELWDLDDGARKRMSELTANDGTGVLEQWQAEFVLVSPTGLGIVSSDLRDALVAIVDGSVSTLSDLHRASKDRSWATSELSTMCGLPESHMRAALLYRGRYLGGCLLSAFDPQTGLHGAAALTYDIRDQSRLAELILLKRSTISAQNSAEDHRLQLTQQLRSVVDRLKTTSSGEAWRSFSAAEWPTLAQNLRAIAPSPEGFVGRIDDAADALRKYVVLPLERGHPVTAGGLRHLVRRLHAVYTALTGHAILASEPEQEDPMVTAAPGDDAFAPNPNAAANAAASERIDVLILTATKLEYDAALKVDDGAIDNWRAETASTGLEVSFRTYSTSSGKTMRVALTRGVRMREAEAVAAAVPLIVEYKPRYLAMCGACAGWRGKTNLGDVIVGDSVWRYNAGAVEVTVDPVTGERKEKFKPEPFGFRLRGSWKQRAESLTPNPTAAWVSQRPKTLEQQELWLLERLAAGDENPSKHADRREQCPDWTVVLQRLRARKQVSDSGLQLTPTGRHRIDDAQLLHPDGLPVPPPFSVRVGAIATGPNVMRDPELFEKLSDTDRTVLAVEMEAAALGVIADISEDVSRSMVVMKGVMDHGDADKNDHFKEFACRAAAECLFAFLRDVVTPEDSGGGRLQRAPAIGPGAVELARFFDEWSLATRPPISEALLIAGRTEATRQLQEWLAGEPSVIGVQAETRDEAVAFVYAAMSPLTAEDRKRTVARSFVVESAERWRTLVESTFPLVLVADFGDVAITVSGPPRGHHVVLPLAPNEGQFMESCVQLPRIGRREGELALQASGIPEDDARELAALARHGLGALRRRLAVNLVTLLPSWAGREDGRRILPALLAESWLDESQADRRILETLSGKPYGEYRELLLAWADLPDAPIRLTGQTWSVTSIEDSWSLLSKYLTGADILTFEGVVLQVLGEPDPSYELPEEERWKAALYGKVPLHSEAIRKGLSQSLALLGTRGESLLRDLAGAGPEWASRIVGKVLAECTTWTAWAAVAPVLSLLAEAAPDRFIQAVDLDLSAEKPLLASLFTDRSQSGFGGQSPHTEMLWALETLAWSPEYLSAAATLLARYASVDPGGKLSNRPIESLRRIFLLWHPSTTASLDQRMRALRLIQARESEIGWRLLIDLIPQPYGMATDTHKPQWRDWAPDERPKITYNEMARGAHDIVQMILPAIGQSGSRWAEVIGALERLAPADLEVALSTLAKVEAGDLGGEDAKAIREALRHQITRNKQFADADWALPAKYVAELESLAQRFEPSDPFEKHRWLFTDRVDLPLPADIDWREREKAINERRVEAAKDIHAQAGEAGLVTLAGSVEQPAEVGAAFARAMICIDEMAFLDRELGHTEQPRRSLAYGFLRARAGLDKAWLESLQQQPQWKDWSARKRADYFHCFEFCAATWDAVEAESSETRALYWADARTYGIFSESEYRRLTLKLLEVGRVGSALLFAARWEILNRGRSDAELVASVLEAAMRGEGTEEIRWGTLSHEMSKLFAVLESSGKVDDERLARLEWNFLPMIERFGGAHVLDRMLGTSPDFFVDALKLVYRADGQEATDVTDMQRALATRGYDLLRKWKRVPTIAADGTLDPDKLKVWVARVRELATGSGRGAIGDIHIGYALVNAPSGADGIWPHEAVRQVIESTASEHLERAIVTGIQNQRGVYTRAMGEGGEQERGFAEKYRGYAVALTVDWPRTARLMKRVADRYDSNAREEDVRAELEEHLYG